jgi:hypothetical protein
MLLGQGEIDTSYVYDKKAREAALLSCLFHEKGRLLWDQPLTSSEEV